MFAFELPVFAHNHPSVENVVKDFVDATSGIKPPHNSARALTGGFMTTPCIFFLKVNNIRMELNQKKLN